MGVNKKEESQYLKDWVEVKEYTGTSYAEEVIVLLKDQGIESVSTKKIYNVMIGSVKDRTILDAIRQVLIKEPVSVEKPNLSNLKLVKA